MKLSKRFAAALIAMCMLLVSLPAFAATVKLPNEFLTLPEDGSSVPVAWHSSGNANSCFSLVIRSEGAKALGINPDNITSRILTDGTGYDGLLLDGTFAINRMEYHVDLSTAAAQVMKYDEVTNFDFANVEVVAIRKTSSGLIVLDVVPQTVMDSIVPGTVKKVNPEALKREPSEDGIIKLNNEDFVTLTTEQESALTGIASRVTDGSAHYDFTASAGYAYNVTLFAKASADYDANLVIDTKNFPEGTIFVAASMLNANGASLKTDWSSTDYYAFPSFSSTVAPFGTYVAQETGDYYVYGLKTHYSSSQSSRTFYATINGTKYTFSYEDGPSSLLSTKGWYWQREKAHSTIHLEKGGLIDIALDANFSYSRAAGLALVPADKAVEMEKIEGWSLFTKTNGFTPDEFAILHNLTAIDYVAPAPVNSTITVNGTAYDVSSVDADELLVVKSTDFDGVPISGVTIADALVKAGIINADNKANYASKINVKYKGLQVYALDQFVLEDGDAITVTAIENLDVTNFAPVNLGTLLSTQGGSDGGLKICFDKAKVAATDISFIHDGTDYVDDAFKGAKMVGYATLTANTTKSYTAGALAGKSFVIPKGGKAYFNDYFSGKVVRSETYGLQSYGVGHANSSDRHMHVVYPDGTIGQHPYNIQQKDFSFENVYLTNSNTTSDVAVRYVPSTGKWQIFTDGAKHVYVVKFKLAQDGKNKTVISMTDHFVTVVKPLAVELKDDESAMVWEYKPYEGEGTGGTTMLPLSQILVNPAN